MTSLAVRVLLSLLLPGVTLLWIPSLLWPPEAPEGPTRLLALPVIAAGIAVLATCIVGFALSGRGTLAPVDPPKKLVTSGLYRFVRNPMYVGGVLVLLGQALYFQSRKLVLYAFLWWVAAHLFVVLYEEPRLARAFHAEYEAYRRAVPRWIPRLRA